MKVLLKDRETRQFLGNEGKWTPAEDEAKHFENPLAAMNFCQLHRLSNTAIVVEDQGTEYEMPLRCDD